MKKMLTLIKVLGIAIMSYFGMSSCTDDESSLEAYSDSCNSIPLEYRDVVSSWGLDPSEMTVFNDGYVVEGDIFISTEQLQYAIYNPTTRQTAFWNLISFENQSPITVSFTTIHHYEYEWECQIKAAIQEWNKVPNCKIKLEWWGRDGGADIVFQDAFSDGRAGIPFVNMPITASVPNKKTGKPGNSILLNSVHLGSSAYTLKVIAMHTIGHALGLHHTRADGSTFNFMNDVSGEYGYQIIGTAEKDVCQ